MPSLGGALTPGTWLTWLDSTSLTVRRSSERPRLQYKNMNNIILLESDGIYTAYQKQATFDSDGNSTEIMVRVQLPMPDPDIPFSEWAKTLSDDEIEVGLQLFFDKWNFTSGNDGDRESYEALHQEQIRRIKQRAEVAKEHPLDSRRSYVRVS